MTAMQALALRWDQRTFSDWISTMAFSVPTMPRLAMRPMFLMVSSGEAPLMQWTGAIQAPCKASSALSKAAPQAAMPFIMHP